MARTPPGAALTETHRLAQLRIGAATAVRVTSLWRLLDVDDLAATTPVWLSTAMQAITTQHTASAATARRYYQEFRTVETGGPLAGTLPTPGMIDEAVSRSLVFTGPTRVERARRMGAPLDRAIDVARVESGRSAQRHALAGGRDTITQAAAADPRAAAWRRVTSAKPCDFCADLAARGAVFTQTTAGFQAHDGCACTAEPAFT
jgi:hypothetical protein